MFDRTDPFNTAGELSAEQLRAVAEAAGQASGLAAGGGYSLVTPAGAMLTPDTLTIPYGQVIPETASFAVTTAQDTYLFDVDATSGNITATLPLGSAAGAYWGAFLRRKDGSANTVTIATTPPDVIDGSGASITLNIQYETAWLVWTGLLWSLRLFLPPTAAGPGTLTTVDVTGFPGPYAGVATLKTARANGLDLIFLGAGIVQLDLLPAGLSQVGVIDHTHQFFSGLKEFRDGIVIDRSSVLTIASAGALTDLLGFVSSASDGVTVTTAIGSYVAGAAAPTVSFEVQNPGIGSPGNTPLGILAGNVAQPPIGDPPTANPPAYAILDGGTLYIGTTGLSGSGDAITGGIITTVGGGTPAAASSFTDPIPGNWAGSPPANVGDALARLAAATAGLLGAAIP